MLAWLEIPRPNQLNADSDSICTLQRGDLCNIARDAAVFPSNIPTKNPENPHQPVADPNGDSNVQICNLWQLVDGKMPKHANNKKHNEDLV